MIRPLLIFSWAMIGLICHLDISSAADEENRFLAKLENGEMIQDKQIRNWYSDNALPQLAGKPLLDGGNPMRWLVDLKLQPPTTPPFYVEMHNGDRLPGEVISSVAANAETLVATPAYFVVAPTSVLTKSSRTDESNELRVDQRYVRKIVWNTEEHLIDRYIPQTLFYKDGRQVRFRSIRFVGSGVSLLLESGRRTARFEELAEIHLAAKDPWEVYYDELTALFPNGFNVTSGLPRLLQLITDTGLVATTSLNRFTADSRGNNNDSDRWLHGIQPVWSLDVIWIPSQETWMRRSWAVERVPLSRLPITEDRSGAMFSATAWHARANRSVQGRTLRTGNDFFGWGLGVIAPSRLSMPVSELAVAFKSQVGIDSIARSGGCIKALIRSESNDGQILYESPVTVGSQQVHESNNIQWKDSKSRPKNLILEVDPVINNRPSGADPFDVRDMTNWLEPIMVLDREKLEQEVINRTPKNLMALRGWEIVTENNKSPKFYTTYREVDYERPTWRTTILAKDSPFSLVKHVTLPEDAEWLALSTGKFGNYGQEPEIEVYVNGQLMHKKPIPGTSKHDLGQTPRYVPLLGFAGQDVELVIRQHPSNEKAPIDWRAIEVLNQRTTLLAALEDPTLSDIESLKTLNPPDAQFSLYNQDDHVSKPAILVSSNDWVQIVKFDKPVPIRERPRLGEFRDLRFAFKKFGGGTVEIQLLHEEQHNRPAIYRFGQASTEEDALPSRLEKINEMPEQWHLRNRNMYSDFKSMNVTGIAVRIPDGTQCIWDHIYFARSYSDLENITSINPDRNNWDHWKTRIPEIKKTADQAMVQIELADGRKTTGAIIHHTEPLIVMPGHLSIFPGQSIQVTLNNGNTYPGKTLGIAREVNIAMASFEAEKPEHGWKYIEPMYRAALDNEEALLLLGSTKAEPSKWTYELMQTLGAIDKPNHWADGLSKEYQLGSVLIDRDKKMAGIISHHLPGGQPVIANMGAVRAAYDRLKKGALVGAWRTGTCPVLGAEYQTTADGISIKQLLKNGPAEKAGIKANDIVIRVHQTNINTRIDIDKALLSNHVNDEVEVEVLRGDQRLKKKIKLGTRM